MGRPPRIQFEGAHYHVFSRGNRRGRIFLGQDDYAAFENILLEAMRWSGVQLFNWSQLPNHFHLNVRTPGGNLAEFMQRLLTRFAKRFNWTHRLVGHVFQGRYGARLIDAENYFQEIVRYVELNPYRIQGKPLASWGQWKWSSLRYYIQPEDCWPEGCQTTFREVLERFDKDAVTARKSLAVFLSDGLKDGQWEAFYDAKNKRFIGDESFVEKMKRQNKEPVRAWPRTELKGMPLGKLLRQVETLSGLRIGDLAAPNKERVASRWRQVVVSVARRIYRIPVIQLAKALGRSQAGISMMVLRSRQKADGWPETEKLLSALSTPPSTKM